MAATDEQRVRLSSLNQAPIDVWSTREKLALATSVQKSGDQNWNSVSRPLKTFAEMNRPSDWFNAKFCAIQYRDMLEKIEVPKRKRERKERGAEETAQDLIVKKLTNERINELASLIQNKIKKFCESKTRYDKLKKKDYDEKFFADTCEYIKKEKKRKRDEQIEHEKWLAERDAKILAMNRRGPSQRPIRTPVSTPTIGDTNLTDEETKIKVLDDKISASKIDTILPVVTEPSSGGGTKDASLLSNPLQLSTPANHKSPKSNVDLTDEKASEKLESPLSESKDDLEKDEYETGSDGTVKMDTDESKSAVAEEVTVDESSEQDETPSNAVKTEVVMEQENSNDTIEEAFESTSEIASKDNSTNTLCLDRKEEPSKTVPTTKDITDSQPIVSETKTPVKDETSKPELSGKREHPDIKEEEDSSFSVVETKSSTLNGNNAENLDTSMRRKRRKSQKVANVTAMQTRSTRSQSQIKVEETKEQVTSGKAESTPKAAYTKKRPNSADETSVDNSEESNDGKNCSSANDSAPSEVEIDNKWRKSALAILRNIQAHRNASLFMQPSSEATESCRKFSHRQMDLNTIKKRLNDGLIRNRIDLKRDLLLMFTNVYLGHSTEHQLYKAAIEMESEILKFLDTPERQKVTRTRERTPLTPEIKTSNRRKTRGSISLENSKSSSKKKN